MTPPKVSIALWLRDHRPGVRVAALELLRRSPGDPSPATRRSLGALALDTNRAVRVALYENIAYVAPYAVAARVLRRAIASDSWWAARAEAVEQLAQIGKPRDVRVIREALGDRSTVVQRSVAFALAKLNDRRSVGALLQRAERAHDPALRAELGGAAYKLGADVGLNYVVDVMRVEQSYETQIALKNIVKYYGIGKTGLANRMKKMSLRSLL